MMNMINPKGLSNNVVNLISNPITEMVCAFIIDISRNYILGFMRPFTGDQLNYLFLVSVFIIIPWIMLGHGAIRYIQNTDETFVDLSNNNLSNVRFKKRNLSLLTFLLAAFGITRLLTI